MISDNGMIAIVVLIIFLVFVLLYIINKIFGFTARMYQKAKEALGLDWGYKYEKPFYCIEPFCYYRPPYLAGDMWEKKYIAGRLASKKMRNLIKNVETKGIFKTIAYYVKGYSTGFKEDKKGDDEENEPPLDGLFFTELVTDEINSGMDYYILMVAPKLLVPGSCDRHKTVEEMWSDQNQKECSLPLGTFPIPGDTAWFWEDSHPRNRSKVFIPEYSTGAKKPSFDDAIAKKKMRDEYDSDFETFKKTIVLTIFNFVLKYPKFLHNAGMLSRCIIYLERYLPEGERKDRLQKLNEILQKKVPEFYK